MIVINVIVGLEIINLAFLVDSRITLIQDNVPTTMTKV